jgi:hypothetical protein
MQLFLLLCRNAGQLVPRKLIFAHLWGSAAIGDDSLNRLVAVLRKALRDVGARTVAVETVPAAGYVLRLIRDTKALSAEVRNEIIERAVTGARDSWRLAWPMPDLLRLETMRRACAVAPDEAPLHGWLAMLCRHAAEYGEPADASGWVRECEASARRALMIDPANALAQVALTSISPLCGRWLASRALLAEIAAKQPDEVVVAHDLSVLEMATGRIRAAKALRDNLIARDPLAANYCYKSIYQNWAVGDHAAMDLAADQATAMWPLHPAVWMARLWTLAFTSRIAAALDMLDDPIRPAIPDRTRQFLRQVLQAAIGGALSTRHAASEASLAVARHGPVHAMAALFALRLLDQPDGIFDVASAYYFRTGSRPVPLHHAEMEPALNEQHRRLTQVLFTPVFDGLRSDTRFTSLCERVGLTHYWDESGLRPDFEGGKSLA